MDAGMGNLKVGGVSFNTNGVVHSPKVNIHTFKFLKI
jgi:hypothetical protein